MITRKQYLDFDGNISERAENHRKYYSQFVNDEVKRMVLNQFTLEELQQSFSKDKHFNTTITPLKKWDAIGGFMFSPTTGETLMQPTTMRPVDPKLIEKAGESFTASTSVCIYKEAAQQILEEQK